MNTGWGRGEGTWLVGLDGGLETFVISDVGNDTGDTISTGNGVLASDDTVGVLVLLATMLVLVLILRIESEAVWLDLVLLFLDLQWLMVVGDLDNWGLEGLDLDNWLGDEWLGNVLLVVDQWLGNVLLVDQWLVDDLLVDGWLGDVGDLVVNWLGNGVGLWGTDDIGLWGDDVMSEWLFNGNNLVVVDWGGVDNLSTSAQSDDLLGTSGVGTNNGWGDADGLGVGGDGHGSNGGEEEHFGVFWLD